MRAGQAVWNVEYRRVGPGGGGGGVPATLSDVAAAAAQLAEVGAGLGLDLGRAAVVGFSAGGHLALWLAGRRDAALRLRLAVSIAGVVDLREGAARHLGAGAVVDFVGGTPEQVPAAYALADPGDALPLGVPQLLVHGTEDPSVPADLSEAWQRRAVAAGDTCDLVIVPDADHFQAGAPGGPGWRAITDHLAAL